MPEQPELDKLNEQAERIRHAEEAAGLKAAPPTPETVSFRTTQRGYRIGTDFIVTVLTFIVAGYVVDHVFETAPWGIMSLMLAGFGVGMLNLWRAVSKSNGDANGQTH